VLRPADVPEDVVDRLIPPSIDEMRAEDENEIPKANSLEGVEIEPTDDHKTHLEIHGKHGNRKMGRQTRGIVAVSA
jgi:hypothetical protein